MKLLDIGIDKLKGMLKDEQTLEILKGELLAIRLREHIFTPEDNKIKNNKLCTETSASLGQNGQNVFWLLAGGLMESTAKLRKTIPNTTNGSLGFSADGLLDFSMLHPYTLDLDVLPENLLKDHSLDLPFTAENARKLKPGTTFQLIGRGKANLSAGVTIQKDFISVGLAHTAEFKGIFTIRLTRDRGETIRVVLSQVTERKRASSLMAKADLSINLGDLIPNKWVSTVEAEIDELNLEKITTQIPGWNEDTNLAEYIKTEGVDKGLDKLGDFLKNYHEFYATLGSKSTQKQKTLVSYEFDLTNPKACEGFEALLHLDDTKAFELTSQDNAGIIRQSYQVNETLGEHYAALGFPGKKLVLASTLRSEREGTLFFDGNTTIMRQKFIAINYDGIVTGSRSIRWEGFNITLNNRPSPLGYWHLSFKHNDKFATKKEIVRFCRFAELLGASPIKDGEIDSFSFVKKIFSSKDNTSLVLDLYFTQEGLSTISTTKKNKMRKLCFTVASHLGYIAPGAHWNNQRARKLMGTYNKTRYDITGENEFDQAVLQKEYDQLGVTLDFGNRDLAKDSAILATVTLLWENIKAMTSSEPANLKGWNGIFTTIGETAKFEYMTIIAVLASLAEPDETLLDKLEFKRPDSGKILVQFDEERDITTADTIFSQAEKNLNP